MKGRMGISGVGKLIEEHLFLCGLMCPQPITFQKLKMCYTKNIPDN